MTSILIASVIWFLNLTYQDRYEAYVRDIAPKYNLEVELVEAIIETESGWEAEAISKDGAVGLMQIVPKYQIKRMEALMVEDIAEPYSNILVGCDYLSELIDKFGNTTEALMFYNGGYKGQELYEKGIISGYAERILNRMEELKMDNYDAFDSYDREQNKWLESLPICDDCGEHIQDEKAYKIFGHIICKHCIDECKFDVY